MRDTVTDRGFDISSFKDRNGIICNIQKSSIATEDCIWLGCKEANPQQCIPGKGWVPIEMPPKGTWVADTRMHLTQNMVQELLPYLINFVETGEL